MPKILKLVSIFLLIFLSSCTTKGLPPQSVEIEGDLFRQTNFKTNLIISAHNKNIEKQAFSAINTLLTSNNIQGNNCDATNADCLTIDISYSTTMEISGTLFFYSLGLIPIPYEFRNSLIAKVSIRDGEPKLFSHKSSSSGYVCIFNLFSFNQNRRNDANGLASEFLHELQLWWSSEQPKA